MGALDPGIYELAKDKNFAAVTVHLASGHAMTHVMWVDATEDELLVNTEVERAKFKAVEHDPRITVMIWQRDNPYVYAEVRGRVVESVRGPEARAQLEELAQKYTGKPFNTALLGSERVMLRIAPDVQHLRRPPA